MVVVDKRIRSEEEGAAFVRLCDADFHRRLTELAQRIVLEDSIECIALSGPSCSGKTTMARILTEEITKNGKCAVVLSIDDFFRERTVPKSLEYKVDYDSVNAIDLPYFAACVDKMLRGENTVLPRFDFVDGVRLDGEEYRSTPGDILIFEGIQAVYPEVTRLLEPYHMKSVCICVTESLTINGTTFAPEEIRLARRIVRDYKFRSATPEFTFHIWEGVRENEEKNILPYINRCDYLIDSLLAYEPFMLAPHLSPLLESVPLDSPYFMSAMSLLEKFRCVEGSEIPESLLTEQSLYHEFLG